MTAAVVVGYGSIGKRHAEVLSQLGLNVSVVSSRPNAVFKRYGTVSEALNAEKPDYVVIANRTSEHYDALIELAGLGYCGNVLVEKPLFESAREFSASVPLNCFVGYNLRFHPVLLQLYKYLTCEEVISAHVYVGQYLPEWRPDTDYSKSYSAAKVFGGGVLRDLSHELDYICWLLGRCVSVTALGGKFSELNIDSDDVYSILMNTVRCPITSIQLNYLDRASRREIIVNTKNHTFKADLVRGTLQQDKLEMTFAALDRNTLYIKQHEAILKGDNEVLCTFRQGYGIVQLIEEIEQAVRQKRWISLA